ncbi:hypothetical protein [Pseudoalteromonas piscicida]
MNTIVKNWHIVSIFDGEELIGKVLWGSCVDNMTVVSQQAITLAHPK